MAKKTSKDTKTKPKTKKTKVTKKKVAKPEKPVVVEEEILVERTPTKVTSPESVLLMFDELISDIENEIERVRETKTPGVKFLRTTNKNLKSLKSKVSTVFRQKRKIKRSTNGNKNSGFLKPVKVSKEMASFTGWKPDELHSRVEVTKALCKYIKDNNLQDPEDRRRIKPDAKLTKLLDYKDQSEPLTYFRIQSCLKNHFPKSK